MRAEELFTALKSAESVGNARISIYAEESLLTLRATRSQDGRTYSQVRHLHCSEMKHSLVSLDLELQHFATVFNRAANAAAKKEIQKDGK